MTVRWTVRAAEPTEQGCARGETAAPTIIHCASAYKQKFIVFFKNSSGVFSVKPRGLTLTFFAVHTII